MIWEHSGEFDFDAGE